MSIYDQSAYYESSDKHEKYPFVDSSFLPTLGDLSASPDFTGANKWLTLFSKRYDFPRRGEREGSILDNMAPMNTIALYLAVCSQVLQYPQFPFFLLLCNNTELDLKSVAT